jgi:hypothetical protein
MVAHPSFFFFFFKDFNFLIFFLHYDTCLLLRVDTCLTISFWMEKLIEVRSLSFPKTQVSSPMRIETEIPKNKVCKPQVPKMSLTLNLILGVHSF